MTEAVELWPRNPMKTFDQGIHYDFRYTIVETSIQPHVRLGYTKDALGKKNSFTIRTLVYNFTVHFLLFHFSSTRWTIRH